MEGGMEGGREGGMEGGREVENIMALNSARICSETLLTYIHTCTVSTCTCTYSPLHLTEEALD